MALLGSAGDPATAPTQSSSAPNTAAAAPTHRSSAPMFPSARIHHLFSGPQNKSTSLSIELAKVGIDCTDKDIVNKHLHDQDLLDDTTWERCKYEMVHESLGVAAGPPCGTFSSLRNHRPGPPVLRSISHLHGMPSILKDPNLKLQLRTDDILAERALEACELMHLHCKAFVLEQFEPGLDQPSLFLFPRAIALAKKPGVYEVRFDQCMFGALTTKPSKLLVFGLALRHLHEVRCNHAWDWHSYSDTSGRTQWKWAKHPPLVGAKVKGEWASKRAAHYPQGLNHELAMAFLQKSITPQAQSS